MSKRAEIEAHAYQRIILHATKFSQSPVYGLVLGGEGKVAYDGVSLITKTVALSHSHPLAPLAESALLQVRETGKGDYWWCLDEK